MGDWFIFCLVNWLKFDFYLNSLKFLVIVEFGWIEIYFVKRIGL